MTALFCDLVGFTPLSESLDPEEVRDIQAEYFSAMTAQIERYGGTVEKYAGDAVLALFGAPVAHEDDAERAVLCALGMQEVIEPVAESARKRWNVEPAIRVGVNTGEVVSGVWNAAGRQDVAVTGDAVNTAARIQAIAEPGEVLVGTETMRLTRRRIRYGEKREVTLKGKMGLAAVYPAVGLRERFGERWETSEQATPLIGRDREMVGLLDAWVRAQAGEGQLVTLVGDAGVGKSRLIAELIDKIAAPSSVRVIRARCLSYGQSISLWLVADLLRSLFGIAEGESMEAVSSKLTAVIPALLAAASPESRSEALDVLGEVLGLPPGESLVRHAGAQIRRQALIRSLKLVVGALASGGAILVVEDLHWIDDSSQEVLKEVLSDVPGLRLLALAAHRPGWVPPWGEWGWTERMALRPLREEDAAVLAGAVLGGMTLSRDLEQYVAERAGGNPFFVEEMLRALEESGGLVEREGLMVLAPGAAERLPATLTEVLLARLDRLEAQVRTVAQVASVIGRTFAVRLLAQVMEREAAALEVPLSALQQAEIAFPRRETDLEYVFKHVSMREAAYQTLVQKRRQELHLATARAIAAMYPTDEFVEMIAYHYARSREDAEAAEWLEKAGDRAAHIYANEAALDGYRQAITRLEAANSSRVEIARVQEKLGAVLFTLARYDEAAQVLEGVADAFRDSQDLEGAGRAIAFAGRALSRAGSSEDGLQKVERAIELLSWNGPSPALVSLHITRARVFQGLGRYSEMLAATSPAVEMAAAMSDPRLEAEANERLATGLIFAGRSSEALRLYRTVIPQLEALGDLEKLHTALNNLGEAHRLTGDLRGALEHNQRALELAERSGSPDNVAFSIMNLGQIRITMGDWDQAQADLERVMVMFAELGTNNWANVPLMEMGRLCAQRGGLGEARRRLESSLELSEKGHDREGLDGSLAALVEVELLEGRSEAAIDRLHSSEIEHGAYGIQASALLAWALMQQQDLQSAESVIDEAVGRGRREGALLALPNALWVQGMLLNRTGRAEEANAALEDALRLARSLPNPHCEARVLLELGRRDEALAIFQRLDAVKYLECLEESRRPAGHA